VRSPVTCADVQEVFLQHQRQRPVREGLKDLGGAPVSLNKTAPEEITMPDPFAYAELHTHDRGGRRDFYRRLFDWRLDDKSLPGGAYGEIDPGEAFPAGMKLAANTNASSHWLPYIRVVDIAASTEKAKQLGAEGIRELVTVPGLGRFSILVDPAGAVFGLWQKLFRIPAETQR
jgi:predicted enzyme related to lactoylglutathione lyase